jgi:peptide/nickel transport system permease protein
MVKYLARRLGSGILVALMASFVIYLFVSTAIDPLGRLATCTTCDPEAFEQIRESYRLDDPIIVRYLAWLGHALTGDLGISRSLGNVAVIDVIGDRIVATAVIAVPAFLLIMVSSLVIALISGARPNGFVDRLGTTASYVLISIPSFVIGLGLQVFWGVWWPGWTGTQPFRIVGVSGTGLTDYLWSAVLPIATLTVIIAAAEGRFARASMLSTAQESYVVTARAKGLAPRRILVRHRLRNALLPIITIWAMDFAILLGGAVVTEYIFAWPGLGTAYLSAILSADLDLVMGISLVIIAVTITFNLIVDIAYGYLDPRVR